MSKKIIPAPVRFRLDTLALVLTVITVIGAFVTYSTFKPTGPYAGIDGALLAACVVSALYSLLVLVLCSRVMAINERAQRLELMVEVLLQREAKESTSTAQAEPNKD